MTDADQELRVSAGDRISMSDVYPSRSSAAALNPRAPPPPRPPPPPPSAALRKEFDDPCGHRDPYHDRQKARESMVLRLSGHAARRNPMNIEQDEANAHDAAQPEVLEC